MLFDGSHTGKVNVCVFKNLEWKTQTCPNRYYFLLQDFTKFATKGASLFCFQLCKVNSECTVTVSVEIEWF